jgi:magnesium transporter
MTSQVTFYLSQIVGLKLYDSEGDRLGRISDVIVHFDQHAAHAEEPFRPKVVGLKTKIDGAWRILDFAHIDVSRIEANFIFSCKKVVDLTDKALENTLPLAKKILDKQIVDINGAKLVRVNDVRLATIHSGTYAVAVDIGTEGLLRRIGVSDVVNKILRPAKRNIETHFILWDDVAAVDDATFNIKLSRAASKLHKLHPSDLADIIEEMGRTSRNKVFAALDEEKAADVLEELEPYAQAQIIESLPLEKAADVLEKMPADEVADLLDGLRDEKAEMLLNEMEKESSEEVRELLEYGDNEVGSIMTTDFLSFKEATTVDDTLKALRRQKPEAATIYSLLVTDCEQHLVATVSLRDLVVAEPATTLDKIMQRNAISVFDDDKIDSLAEIIAKYNLLAIPVTSRDMKMEGMVVIDDIVEDLLDERKTE